MQLYQHLQVRQPVVFLAAHLGASAASPAPFPRPVPRRKYRTELPNLIDDLGLSVYAHRLYCHIRLVCGALAGGYCNESTATLIEKTKMSAGSVSDAKKELLKAGLVHIVPGSKKLGTTDYITLIDVWEANFAYYSQFAKSAPNQGEGVHGVNKGSSSGETKKQSPSEPAQPNTDEKTTTEQSGPTDGAVVVASTPTASQDAEPALIAQMAQVVGSEDTARKLVSQHGAARCKQQLAWLPHRNAKDEGAVYAMSLRGDGYSEPATLRKAREARELREQAATQKAVQHARADNEAKGKTARTAALMAYYASLPSDQRTAVDAATLAEAKTNRLFERMKPDIRALHIELTREKILAQWKDGKTHA